MKHQRDTYTGSSNYLKVMTQLDLLLYSYLTETTTSQELREPDERRPTLPVLLLLLVALPAACAEAASASYQALKLPTRYLDFGFGLWV